MKQGWFYQKKVDELQEIQNIRQAVGLGKIKMGFQICLCCDNQFFSEDLKNQKMCDGCRWRKDDSVD